MGRLLLIRHGETVWNKEGRYQGQTDIPLSPLGVHQAQRLAAHLQKETITHVISSDLSRAYETAQIIAEKHGLPVVVDEGLREFCFGVWEGLTRTEIQTKYKDHYYAKQQGDDVCIPGAETAFQVRQRVTKCISSYCQRYDGVLVFVSHGGTIRQALLAMLNEKESKRIILNNTGISTVSYALNAREVVYTVEKINATHHLASN